MYDVKVVSEGYDIDEIQKIELNHALWNTVYQPKTIAQMWIVKNEGVYLRMECFEKNPKCVYHHQDDPVYKDSCMECFINFNPLKSTQYLNIEINANGALLMQVGSKRKDRRSITSFGVAGLKPQPFKTETSWGFVVKIPIRFIKYFYEEIALEWTANFYKCGDECLEPHYLSWQKIDLEKPNYHAPQFFGNLRVHL